MAFSVTITDRETSSSLDLDFAIPSTLTVAGAEDISVTASGGVPGGTLQEVLQHLADQNFRSSSAPTGNSVAEGDTWYDTANNQQYVYRETSSGVFQWVPIIFGDTDSDTLDSGTF